MAIGASLGGLLADRIGRRQVFALTLLVYGVATGASALVTGLGLLLVLRFLVGLGLGAELPVASTLVSEYAPARIRGRVVVALEAFWALGLVAGRRHRLPGRAGARRTAGAGLSPSAWSPRPTRSSCGGDCRSPYASWNGRGATREAEAAVRRFEASAGVERQPRRPSATSPSAVRPSSRPPAGRALWSPTYRRRTLALWLTWFGTNFSYYGAFIWLPSLLVASGFTLVKSFEYTLIITVAQLPGLRRLGDLDRALGADVRPWPPSWPGRRCSAVAFGLADSVPAVLGRRHGPVVLQPRRLGGPVRGDPGGVSDRPARHRRRAAPPPSVGSPRSSPRCWSRCCVLDRAVTGLFTVFAVAFAVAAVAALFLSDMRGRSLD